MSLFIVGLDNTIVNVALPSIQHDLQTDLSDLQWVIDAYLVVLASLLMLSGSTGDRLGRKRTFQTGLVLFVIGSALCSLAPTLGWLIAARAIQGIGGSMLNPVAMAIITNTFTDARERARAIGVWGGVVGVSMALGPVLGGGLVEWVGWRSIFWINIPVGLVACVLCARFVPESRAEHPRRIDPIGQVLVAGTLGLLTFGIIEAPRHGWTSAQTLACLGGAAVALVLLVAYELRRRQPLIDPRFFRSAPFAGAAVIAICGFSALSGFLFLNTFYLQHSRGFSPLQAGLATLPMAAMSAVCAPLSGRLLGRSGPRLPLLIAGAGLLASTLMMTRLSMTTSHWTLYATYLVFGIGFGFLNAPITNTAVSGMPRSEAGVAAAIASTSRQIGQSLGVAVIGSLVVTSAGAAAAADFPQASHVGWWVTVGCACMVLLLGVVTTSRAAHRTAETSAERILARRAQQGASA